MGESAMPNTHGLSNGAGALPESLRARLARAEDGVWVTTPDGRIVFWNRAAEAALGVRAREVCGRTCAEVLAGRDEQRRRVCGPGCDAPESLNPVGVTFGVPTHAKDGRDVWLEVMTFTTSGHEAPPLVVHIFHDVTRTKALIRDLRPHIGQPANGGGRLTPRELEVLRLMAAGHGTAAAAARLRVSRATFRNHVQNIFGKLGVHTRLEAVAHATRHRLL
jgi:PAS domain S-box-containing protein